MTAPAPHVISPRMTPGDWAQLLLLSLIWGGSIFLTGIAVKGLPVLTLVAVRVFVAALVLWACTAAVLNIAATADAISTTFKLLRFCMLFS